MLKPSVTLPLMKFATHALLGLKLLDADQYNDDAPFVPLGPPTAAKPGSMQVAEPHVVAWPVGLVPDAGSAGSASATVVTPGPTKMLCSSEIAGKRQSEFPAKPEVFRSARNTL